MTVFLGSPFGLHGARDATAARQASMDPRVKGTEEAMADGCPGASEP